MVNPLEGRNDFLIVGHHDDGRIELLRHLVEDAHDTQGAFAIQGSGRLIGEDNGRLIGQGSGNGDALLLPAR